MGQAQEAEHTKKNKKQQGEGGEKGGRRKALINKNMLINVKVRRNTEAQLPWDRERQGSTREGGLVSRQD